MHWSNDALDYNNKDKHMAEEYINASGTFMAGAAALGGLAFAVVKWRTERARVKYERERRMQAEHEITFSRAALGFPDFIHEWDSIGEELIRLVEQTEVDLVLILRAWNGRLEPRWTTAVYQMRRGNQTPIAYVHFELDRDYVNRIREIVQKGSTYFEVKDLPACAIKDVYDAEGVTASYWAHINSVETSDDVSKAIAYASFSTHEEGGMSRETQTRCKIVTGRLKGLAAQFDMNTALKQSKYSGRSE